MELSIQEVFKKFGNSYIEMYNPTYHKLNIYNRIITCRTKKQGTRIYKCKECGKKIYTYKSCMDRHCPTCLEYKKELWIEKHKYDILDINYYHIVLCLPKELYPLFYYNQKVMYDLLFKISSEVIIDLCYEYLGIKVGITSILHTWSQKGKYYPHIHMLVTGGGMNKLGKWIDSELVSSDVIKTRFKNRLLKCIKKLRLNFYGAYSYLNNYDNYIRYIDNIENKEFICYKNKPYNKVFDIYEYFGKHAFRVWIENERIVKIDDTHVYFTYRNYDNKNETKVSKVRGEEFIRRFLSHSLNKSFIKIRYYGIMSCKNKTKKLRKLQILTKTKRIKEKLIDKLTLLRKIVGRDVTRCPKCNGKLYLYKETYVNKSPPNIIQSEVIIDA